MEPINRNLLEDGRRLLGQCILFRGFSPTERGALLARARIRHVAAGEVIFSRGAPGDSMMAVLSGTVRISIGSTNGREIVLAILQPGEIFGEIALLDGKERTADARAMNTVGLAILDRRDVLAFFEREPSHLRQLITVLCDRLRQTDEHIAEIALLQLPVRLAKSLLRIACATQGASTSPMPIQLSQRELANLVGATRESVNRILRDWHRRGMVRIEESSITITDADALEDLAELTDGAER